MLVFMLCYLSVLFFSHTNDYSYEVKQAAYVAIGVGTIFFLFTSMLGGNAATSRYLEKDKARIHDTKFMAHVSGFITLNHLTGIVIINFVIIQIIMQYSIPGKGISISSAFLQGS